MVSEPPRSGVSRGGVSEDWHMASYTTRGGSIRVRIYGDKSKVVASRSFRDHAEAHRWGEAEDEKVAFRRKHGDFILHPSGSATYMAVASGPVTSGGTLTKPDLCSKAEA